MQVNAEKECVAVTGEVVFSMGSDKQGRVQNVYTRCQLAKQARWQELINLISNQP